MHTLYSLYAKHSQWFNKLTGFTTPHYSTYSSHNIIQLSSKPTRWVNRFNVFSRETLQYSGFIAPLSGVTLPNPYCEHSVVPPLLTINNVPLCPPYTTADNQNMIDMFFLLTPDQQNELTIIGNNTITSFNENLTCIRFASNSYTPTSISSFYNPHSENSNSLFNFGTVNIIIDYLSLLSLPRNVLYTVENVWGIIENIIENFCFHYTYELINTIKIVTSTDQ